MMPSIITALVGVVAGLLMGGCTPGSGDISKQLLHRNAQLENQLTSAHATLTSLAISAVLLAAGLGASIYKNRKGVTGGKTKSRTKTGR